jgi:hypothetical protein
MILRIVFGLFNIGFGPDAEILPNIQGNSAHIHKF